MKILEDKDYKFVFQLALLAFLVAGVLFLPYMLIVSFFLEVNGLDMSKGYFMGAAVSVASFVSMARDIKQFVSQKSGVKKIKVKNFLRQIAFFCILVVLFKRLSANLVGLAGGVVLFQFGIFIGVLFLNKINEQKGSKSEK